MFTSLTVAVAVLPALSVTVKVCDWPAPSVRERVSSAVAVNYRPAPRQTVAGHVARCHVGVVPAVGVGRRVPLRRDRRGRLVDVHVADGGRGRVARLVRHREGVRLALSIRGERVISRGGRIIVQPREDIAGHVARCHVGVVPAVAVGRRIALSAAIVGATVSMFTSLTVAVAVLPALSVTVKVCDWPSPSVVNV